MKCPYCGYEESKVTDTRSSEDGDKIKRRRVCIRCERRFTTFEAVENDPIIVVKRDNSRELFDKNKLTAGIMRACKKRPIPYETIEGIASNVESELQGTGEAEVQSQHIGELVLSSLRLVDEVAYIRFASVYRQFKDVNSFMEELNRLMSNKN